MPPRYVLIFVLVLKRTVLVLSCHREAQLDQKVICFQAIMSAETTDTLLETALNFTIFFWTG